MKPFNPLDPPHPDDPDDGYTWRDLGLQATAELVAGLITLFVVVAGCALWDMIGGAR